ncbi:MAG: hypothetical protein A2V79_04845 [Betaproteobacteria bacterium RBG_16_56_24]|nr:MAG: hypothetical protein A2V79_04845 [Betaproteobacteria bacterium RBG_16_56_24]
MRKGSKMIKVLFFGPVAERIGGNALQVEHRPGICLQDVRDELAAQYPQAFEIVCFAAANGEHVRDMSLPLADNSEVAFMARFSGG